MNEKRSKEFKFKITSKKEILDEAIERKKMRSEDLATKKSELDEIIAETQAQEEKLKKKSNLL